MVYYIRCRGKIVHRKTNPQKHLYALRTSNCVYALVHSCMALLLEKIMRNLFKSIMHLFLLFSKKSMYVLIWFSVLFFNFLYAVTINQVLTTIAAINSARITYTYFFSHITKLLTITCQSFQSTAFLFIRKNKRQKKYTTIKIHNYKNTNISTYACDSSMSNEWSWIRHIYIYIYMYYS